MARTGIAQPLYTNCTQCHAQVHGTDRISQRGRRVSLLDKKRHSNPTTKKSLTVTGGTYDTAATNLRRYRAAPAPSWGWAADGQESQPGSQASDGQASGSSAQANADGEPIFQLHPERYLQDDVRFGWWAMWHSGSPAKVGEYQSLDPSPFWDVDGISSDGTRTLDFTATGTDQDTTTGKLYYYQPGVSAKVDYERFLHQLDHDPLSNMAPTSASQASPATTNPKIIQQDLGAGQDYAVRVQELKASFKGDLCRQRQGPPGRVGNAERRDAAGQRRRHVLQPRPPRSRPTILR